MQNACYFTQIFLLLLYVLVLSSEDVFEDLNHRVAFKKILSLSHIFHMFLPL